MLSCYSRFNSFCHTSNIFNFIQLDDRVATSGQPTEAQFGLVKEAGYTTVINLAPKSHENALGNEDEILESMGIRYLHLPVVFTNPTRDDFECFIDALESFTRHAILFEAAQWPESAGDGDGAGGLYAGASFVDGGLCGSGR